MLGAAHGPFRGAHGPASEFPSLPARPPGAPTRRPHLAPGGSHPASPPRSAPRPWPRAAAPRPPAPFREPPPGGQATPLRLPPPAAPLRTGGPPGRPQAKCTKKPSWVIVPSLPQSVLLFLSPPVFPSVSLPWWVGAETLSCLSFPAAGQLLFFGSLSVPCFSPRKDHHFSKVLSPKQKLNPAQLGSFSAPPHPKDMAQGQLVRSFLGRLLLT